MARITLASGVTLPGYSYGTKFATQLTLPVASSRAIPVIRNKNTQANSTVKLAYIANYWQSIGSLAQTLWYPPPMTRQQGYNAFAKQNTFSLTWNMPTWDAPPHLPVYAAGPIVAWHSLDDQATTILNVIMNGVAPPPNGLYVHLYTNWTVQAHAPGPKSPGYVYTGSVGPLVPQVNYFYDVTPIITAWKGVWIAPFGPYTPGPVDRQWYLNTGYYLSDSSARVYQSSGSPSWEIVGGFFDQTSMIGWPAPLSQFYNLPPWQGVTNQPG